MAHSSPSPVADVPRWLIILGSVAIAFHVSAVAVSALAAYGPFSPMTEAPMPPPQFAITANAVTGPYLNAIKFTHDYHFRTNQPDLPGVKFEVRLKDDSGKEIATLQFPDAQANGWVAQRQTLLARNLGNDLMAAPPQSEVIAAPNQEAEIVRIWEPFEQSRQQIKSVASHLIPRDRMVWQPAEWSILTARAYARHLCRVHDAASASVIRTHQEPYRPMILFTETPPPAGEFDPTASDFGDIKADGTSEALSKKLAPRRR